jgi:hypothetical protein
MELNGIPSFFTNKHLEIDDENSTLNLYSKMYMGTFIIRVSQ